MEYMSGEMVRQGFGFANPNHAATAICALFPFCWGWRGRWRWVGRLIGAALCVMLAMTYSRTGFVVLVIEAAVLWWRGALGSAHPTSVRGRRWNAVPTIWGIILAVCLACVAAWWMWPRLALDGAILNRPKIWLAGLRLFATNPMGVGFGNSGEIASALMLPDGITVRTLVNSHLTLFAEMGAFVGGAWLAFIALALCVGWRMRRTWIAFAGLAVSAFSASVFDWHVLFDFAAKGGYGVVNFALAWGLFVAFVVMGVAMIGVWGWEILTQRRRGAERFGLSGVESARSRKESLSQTPQKKRPIPIVVAPRMQWNIDDTGSMQLRGRQSKSSASCECVHPAASKTDCRPHGRSGRGPRMSESRGGDDNRVLLANCGLCDTRPRRFFVLVGLAGVVIGLCAAVVGFRSDATPKVEGEYVVVGGRVGARVPTDGGPCVYRDEGWGLKSVAKRFPDGARFCIRPGVPEDVVDSGEVWLFGDAAESAWRFPAARLTLVSPPEFFDPPTNAVVVSECSFRQD